VQQPKLRKLVNTHRRGNSALIDIFRQLAFLDPHRVIVRDLGHSETEARFYCFGRVKGGILTVRFTYRTDVVRIIGAGYWRKGKAIYEKENNLYQ
jgi:uncharacterized protein